MNRKKLSGSIAKIFSTLLILFLLFRLINFDLREFKTALISIKPFWILLSFNGVIIVLALKSYRWHLLLKHSGIFFSPLDSLKSYFSSYAVGIVTPGRLGEFIKIYNVRQKTGANLLTSLQNTLTDRLFDLVMLLVFSVSWAIMHLIGNELNQLFAILMSISIVIGIILIIKTALKKLTLVKTGKFHKLLNFIYGCLLDMTRKTSFYLWLITLSAYFFFFLTTWFLFRSLNISISLIDSGFIISIVGLVLLLPISIAGFGPREFTLVYVLSLYGISPESAITFSLLQFTVFFAWGGLIGLLFWIVNPTPLEAIKADSIRMYHLIKDYAE